MVTSVSEEKIVLAMASACVERARSITCRERRYARSWKAAGSEG
jgi:hypothetical protein